MDVICSALGRHDEEATGSAPYRSLQFRYGSPLQQNRTEPNQSYDAMPVLI
jgi:hypothetical protein